MSIDTNECKLISKSELWSLPLVKKHEHMYFEFSESDILFTVTEFKNIHKQLLHPKSGRPYALTKRASPAEIENLVRKDLKIVTEECDICQRHGQEPDRFRV